MEHDKTNEAAATTEVLARIPDVDAVDTIPIDRGQTSGGRQRLLSEALSARLLLAGGVVLLLAAVVPFLIGKKENSKPSNESLPAWQPGPPAPAPGPASTLNGALAQTPKPQPGVPKKAPAAKRQGVQSPEMREARRSAERPKTAGDPSYRHPQVSLNQPMTLGGSTDRGIERRDYQADERNNVTAGLAERRIATPDSAPGDGARWTAPSQPGVARFEGIIESPPVRTTDERPRPGIY
jgi:hypothetical protein